MKYRLPYKAGERVRLTSAYGYRTDPISGEAGSFHGGIDLVGQGSKVLCSPVDGQVLVSQMVTDRDDRTWEWGNYVCIMGDDGNLCYLCHLKSRSVSAGERVAAGDEIGTEGSTGYSTGSHCHFEVRDATGKQLDPAPLLGIDSTAGTEWTAVAEQDNAPSEWSREAVSWAVSSGILQGDGRGDLMLGKNATREQISVMLYRMYEKLKREETEE